MFVFQSKFSLGDRVYVIQQISPEFPVSDAYVDAITISRKNKSKKSNQHKVTLNLRVVGGGVMFLPQEEVFNSEAEALQRAEVLRNEAMSNTALRILRERRDDLKRELARTEGLLREREEYARIVQSVE